MKFGVFKRAIKNLRENLNFLDLFTFRIFDKEGNRKAAENVIVIGFFWGLYRTYEELKPKY